MKNGPKKIAIVKDGAFNVQPIVAFIGEELPNVDTEVTHGLDQLERLATDSSIEVFIIITPVNIEYLLENLKKTPLKGIPVIFVCDQTQFQEIEENIHLDKDFIILKKDDEVRVEELVLNLKKALLHKSASSLEKDRAYTANCSQPEKRS